MVLHTEFSVSKCTHEEEVFFVPQSCSLLLSSQSVEYVLLE